jgi:hypothetical protein
VGTCPALRFGGSECGPEAGVIVLADANFKAAERSEVVVLLGVRADHFLRRGGGHV